MSHSPEPWKYIEKMDCGGSPSRDHCDLGGFVDRYESPVCWFGNHEMYYPTDGSEPTKDDAERIVACVNACRGLSTDLLMKVSSGTAFIGVRHNGEPGGKMRT